MLTWIYSEKKADAKAEGLTYILLASKFHT